MDKNLFVSKLNKIWPGSVLESREFGRSGVFSVWLEAKAIGRVASALKDDAEVRLDWLENLSVVELEEVMVVTYFLRSTVTAHSLVLRISAVPESKTSWVKFPSIRDVWTMGTPMEKEAEELFGIQFDTGRDVVQRIEGGYLPEGCEGFPLRKSFKFPKAVMGLSHSRPLNHSVQKKFES